MNVIIDRENCVSCGTCWETCPAVFEQDPVDSFSRVIEKIRSDRDPARGTVPQELETCVTGAEDLCPVQVIHTGQ